MSAKPCNTFDSLHNPWMLPNITDYTDPSADSIARFADMLKISPHPESDLKAIKEAVSEHTRVLPLKWLWNVSWVFADHLYIEGNRLPTWTEQHRQYLDASAATFFQKFHEKGYVLRYFIKNTFEQTDFGMLRPLYLLPALFAAAGLHYVCAEWLGLVLMERDGIAHSDFLKQYGRYQTASRDVARRLLRICNEARKSYVVLEMGDNNALLNEMTADSETNVVIVLRFEPPIADSNVHVVMPMTVAIA